MTLGLVIALQVVFVNFWPRFESPNEWGRVYQALAVVSRGSLEISIEVERYGGMEDLASFEGRTYPNKAPGMLPLLLPGALAARILAPNQTESTLRLALVLGRVLACGVPFLITVLLLTRLVVVRFPAGGPLAVAAYALASPALAASLLLFSHALTACLLLAAYLLLFVEPRPGAREACLAGLLLGWAAVCEYPLVLPGTVLALASAPRLRWRGVLAGIAGAAVPFLLLGLYDTTCFGGPFALASAHETYGSFAGLEGRGLFGVGRPTLAGLAGLLASPTRGLLVWAPLSALAIAGAPRRTAWRGDTAARLALVAAPAVLVVAMSGYPNWHGGWFPGPRYLLAVLPLVFVLVTDALKPLLRFGWARLAVALCALWGAAQVWPLVATFPFPPEDYPLPFATLSPALLAEGIHAPSSLPGSLVVWVFMALAAAAVALLFLLAMPGARPAERFAAVALVLAVVLLAGRVARPATWQASLEYAVIHDVYAGGARGALEALAPQADTPGRSAQLRRWLAKRDAPRLP